MRSSNNNPAASVFLDAAPWDLRSRNTDWRYVRHFLPRLVEWQPALRLVSQTSPTVTLRSNLKTLRMALGKRVHRPLDLFSLETDLLDAAELKRSGCDVVFSHRGFPLNAGHVPVIWQSSILDPVMTRSYIGDAYSSYLEETEVRLGLFHRARLIQVSTRAEARRLGETYPNLAGRFVPIPFFLPRLKAVPQEALDRHRAPSRVEILFVGNEARRKGLDLLLAAFDKLPENLKRSSHLTIVSNFDGIPVEVQPGERITVLRGAPHDQVLTLMRNAHILVNVARYESYGFIFPEAMSQGTVCLGPAWEVQRELLEDGRAGLNLPCEVDPLAEALRKTIEDHAFRFNLAQAAWTRFHQHLSPEVVAGQYAAMFASAARPGPGTLHATP